MTKQDISVWGSQRNIIRKLHISAYMKIQSFILSLLTILLLHSCGNEEAVSYHLDEIPVEPNQFEEDFQSIHETVREEFSMIGSKGIDMDSLYKVSMKDVRAATTKVDYSKAVLKYFTGLKCGHANPLFDYYYIPQHIACVDGHIFVKEIETEWLKNNSQLLAGDEITTVDGMSIEEWLSRRIEITPGSTNQYKQAIAANGIFSTMSDTTLSLTILREGKHLNMTFKPSEFYTNAEEWQRITKNTQMEIIADSVGVIHINAMMIDKTNVAFDSCYAILSKLPYLIIDIRNNGGGDSRVGEYICQYLIEKTQKACISGLDISPAANHYKGKTFLLTSPFTFSAAESFAIDLKESGQVTVVGEPTGGDTGNGPKLFSSKYGIWFRIPTREAKTSPKGFPLEGIGVPVDYEIHQSISDAKHGIDTQIKYILEQIIHAYH